MKIDTRYFGEMDVDQKELVHFVQPIYGFDKLLDYALLSDSTIGDCFLWLQSIDVKETCFILVDPAVLATPYTPTIPNETLHSLGKLDKEDMVIRLVAVIHDKFADSTVNLKCPIVINTTGRVAAQIMLEDDYPIRAPLIDGGEGEPMC